MLTPAARHAASAVLRRSAASSAAAASSRIATPARAAAVASCALRAARTQPQIALASRRAFSSTAAARGQGESDGELSASLAEEIKYEHEEAAASSSSQDGGSDVLATFREEGAWKVDEKDGGDEIALVREFGNEHIRVLFSIGDLDSSAPVPGLGEDGESAAQDGAEDADDASFPVRVAITISKPNKGALNVDAQVQDGEFLVEAVSFYSDEKLASDLTVEADWARRGLYVGPQFETLEEKVQDNFYAFLEERGIDAGLALVIPELAENKEQREYCRWLENVKTFVDA